MKSFAVQLSRNSTITDEQAQSLLSFGLALGRTAEESKVMAQAAVDLAAATGTDVDTAMQKLNATLSGSAMGLSKTVRGVKDLSEEQLKAGAAIKLVSEQFRGMAEGAVNTLPGALNQAGKAFGELSETFGKTLADAFDLKGLTNKLTSMMNVLRVFLEQSQNAFKSVGEIINGVWNSMNLLFQRAVEYASKFFLLIAKIPGASKIINVEELNKLSAEYGARADESSKQAAINFGLIDKPLESAKEKTKQIGANFKSAGVEALKFGEDAMKALMDIEKQNQEIAFGIAEGNLSQKDQIRARLSMELNSINNKMKEIEASKKLNALEKERILQGLSQQKGLVEEKAKVDEKKAGGPNAFMQGVSKISSSVSQFGGWVGAIVSAIGSLGSIIQELNKMVINMFNGLSNMGDEMKKLVPELVASVVKFTEEFLPEFIEAFANTSLMMTEMLNKLPDATFKALKKLPEVLMKALGETLPKLIEEIFQLLIATPIEIIEKVLDALWNSMDGADFQKIIGNIIQSIVKGILNANNKAIQSMRNILSIISGKKISIDGESVSKAMETVRKNLTGATSQLFAVTELTAEAGKEKIKNIADKAVEDIKGLWDQFMEALNEAWKVIKALFWDPFIMSITDTWNVVYEHVIKPMIEGITAAWKWVWENVLQPIGGLISDGWKWVVDNVVLPLKDFAGNVWSSVNEKLIQPIKDAFGGMWDKFDQYLIAPLRDIFDFEWPSLPSFTIEKPKWLDNLPSGVTSLFKSRGGPIYAADGQFVPRGTDTVPAMLTPGEFVVQKSAVQSLGLSAMNQINKGQMPAGSTSVNIDLKINTTEAIDESYVRNRLIPRIKEEFRRSSLDGAFILAGSGIR
jgi:hypothetical protein